MYISDPDITISEELIYSDCPLEIKIFENPGRITGSEFDLLTWAGSACSPGITQAQEKPSRKIS